MTHAFHLFEVFGIELEYMLVDRETLDVCPKVDEILRAADGGAYVSDFTDGPVSWSNELVRHVVEVKVTDPVTSLNGVESDFEASVQKLNQYAGEIGARLMPGGVHPWMNPAVETQLWPHAYAEIYETYHRIFNCYRHGWANLQSVHLNLPFCGDEEFGRLHAAIRLVLPLLPALAASSPVIEGRVTGHHDSRLDVYVNNSKLVDHIAGRIIPEPVYTEADYRDHIFTPMMEGIKPFNQDGILEEEFLNSRGAIARFDRGAIEIRLIDVQECPAADLAIVHAVVHALRLMVDERCCSLVTQMAFGTEALRGILNDTIVKAEHAVIADGAFLAAWGVSDQSSCTAGELWHKILEHMPATSPSIHRAIQTVLNKGTLASRMLNRLGARPDRDALKNVYAELADCLSRNEPFV